VIFLFRKDYYDLTISKASSGSPVLIVAEEKRTKNVLRSKRAKKYTLETTEKEINALLDPVTYSRRVPTLEEYMDATMKHLKFDSTKEKLRLLNRLELNKIMERKKQLEEERSKPPKKVKRKKKSTIVDKLGFDRSGLAASSVFTVRRNFLRQLSNVRSYWMEQPEKSQMDNSSLLSENSAIGGSGQVEKMPSPSSSPRWVDTEALLNDEDEDKNSTTSDDFGPRVLEIHDCGHTVPAHPMWGTPGIRTRPAKNKYLFKHGGKNTVKMSPEKKASGGFRSEVYVSNLTYSKHMTLGKHSRPKILLGNAKSGKFGKLYRHWSTGKIENDRSVSSPNISFTGEYHGNYYDSRTPWTKG
jgi:hypothetical protein